MRVICTRIEGFLVDDIAIRVYLKVGSDILLLRTRSGHIEINSVCGVVELDVHLLDLYGAVLKT